MNSTKTKLFAAIAMLVVAAIAMTGTSFAWFTISTAPRVDNLEVEMAATRNFEIAAIDGTSSDAPLEPKPGDATVGQTKWGATVKFASSAALVFPMTVSKGATDTELQNKSIYYDTTGRVDGLKNTSLGAFNTSGVAYYFADIVGTDTAINQKWVTCGAVYGVWLRANHAVQCSVSMGGFEVKNAAGAPVYDDSNTQSIRPVSGEAVTVANTRVASCASVSLKFVDQSGTEKTVTSGGFFEMKANVAYKVYITVFFDGENLYARDIEKGLKVSNFNVEFIDQLAASDDHQLGTNQGGTYTPLQQY